MGAVGHAYKSANKPGCPVNIKCEPGVQVDRSRERQTDRQLITCHRWRGSEGRFLFSFNDVPLNERYLEQRPG